MLGRAQQGDDYLPRGEVCRLQQTKEDQRRKEEVSCAGEESWEDQAGEVWRSSDVDQERPAGEESLLLCPVRRNIGQEGYLLTQLLEQEGLELLGERQRKGISLSGPFAGHGQKPDCGLTAGIKR